MSDPVRPQRRQPPRLPRPWDSPGKNTGVGCHFLLQCMKVKSQSEVAQSCPTLSDPVDCSLPGSSVHGIFRARVLEWGAIAFSDNGILLSHKKECLCWSWSRGVIRLKSVLQRKSPGLGGRCLLLVLALLLACCLILGKSLSLSGP